MLKYDLNQVLQKNLPQVVLQWLEYYFPDRQEELRQVKRKIQVWFVVVFERIFVLAIFALCTWGFYWFLLGYVQYLWQFFLSTPTGEFYSREISWQFARSVSSIFARDLKNLTLLTSLYSLLGLLAVGVVSQLCALRRLFYEARSWGVRLVWCLGMSGVVSFFLAKEISQGFIPTFLLSVLPTLCLLHAAFRLCAKIAPELNVLALVHKIQKIKKTAEIRAGADPGKGST